MVSIIVPAYNVERYIEACLRSVIAQSVSDWELIVVDDGSTDDTGAICQRVAATDARIRYVHQSNSGVAAARNNAMRLAVGEWLMFLDGDDLLDPHILERLLERAAPDVDIICCGFVAFSEESGLRVERGFFPNDMSCASAPEKVPLYLQLMDGRLEQPPGKKYTAIGVPWGKLYRARMLRDAGISFPALRRMQDNLFNTYAFGLCERIVYRNEPLYLYRVDHADGNFPPPEIRYAVIEAREEFFSQHPELMTAQLRDEFEREKLRCLGAALKERCSGCGWFEARKQARELCALPIYARLLRRSPQFSPAPRYRLMWLLGHVRLYGALALCSRAQAAKKERYR